MQANSDMTAPPAAAPVPPPDRRAPADWRRRMLHSAVHSSFFWILAALLIIIGIFSVITPAGTFVSVFNLQAILGDSSVLLILAVAGLFVIVGGGLDLSTGSVMTFGGVGGLLAMQAVGIGHGWLSIGIGALVGVGSGMLWGAINGFLIAYCRISPFVVTLGSLTAVLGAARLICGGNPPTTGPPQLQGDIGLGLVAGVPVIFLIAAVVVIVAGVTLSLTRFGERVYLLGSSEEAADRAGLHVPRLKLALYVLAGAIAGLAGIVDLSRFDTAAITTGHQTELLASIAAVIIGGASLTGGVGSMAGAVVGVFLPTVLNNGLIIMGLQRFWQDVAVGCILVIAVAFDQWRRGGYAERT
jgi:ribose transport system permease protein